MLLRAAGHPADTRKLVLKPNNPAVPLDPRAYVMTITESQRQQAETAADVQSAFCGLARLQIIGDNGEPPPLPVAFSRHNDRPEVPTAVSRIAASIKVYGKNDFWSAIPVVFPVSWTDRSLLVLNAADPTKIPLLVWKPDAEGGPNGGEVLATGGQHRRAAVIKLAAPLWKQLKKCEKAHEVLHRHLASSRDLKNIEKLADSSRALEAQRAAYKHATLWTVAIHDRREGVITSIYLPPIFTCLFSYQS